MGEMPPRFVIPSPVSPGQKWHVVQHNKFPKKLTITQKRRMQRQRAMEKRQLSKEMPQGKPKEAKFERTDAYSKEDQIWKESYGR